MDADGSDPPARPLRVLFVCHANLCRSPLAEGILRHRAAERGLADRVEVDSAGTYAMDGSPPHPRSVAIARAHGIDLSGRSRSLEPEDLARFDEVLVMDRRNLADVERYVRLSAFGRVEGPRARIRLARTVADPGARGADLDVPDPFRGGAEGYARVFEMLDRIAHALLDERFGPRPAG